MEWISVKEKLPKNGQKCLVYCYDKDCYNHGYIDLMTYVNNFNDDDIINDMLDDYMHFEGNKEIAGFYWPYYEYHEYCLEEDVTHWMPLPEFPNDNF